MALESYDQERILRFYQDSLREYGEDDPRTLHWMNNNSQLKRFEMLLTVANMRGSSLLDVGCGLGDLSGFLKANGVNVTYTGIDIIPEFIETAKKHFPDQTFKCQDIFDVTEKYDYVLASGSLTFKVKGNDAYYENMIKKMFGVANKAVAFNMLRNDTFAGNETYATYSPNVIGDFCKTLTPNVQILIDYLPDDFTVFMYK